MIKRVSLLLVISALIAGNCIAQSLDNYLDSGLKNSPLLYDLNNQKLAGKLDSLLVLASFKAQVNQLSQVMHPPSGPGWGYDDGITNGGNYSAVLNVTKPLFHKKQISGELQSLELISQTIKNNEKITLIDLRKSITNQYLTAYADFIQNQFCHTVLTLLNQELITVKMLVDKGIYQMTDLMNLQLLISSQKIAIDQSFIQLTNDVALLNFICGITNQREANLIKPEIPVKANPDPENSPLFAQFRIDSLKNLNSKLLVDLNYRPRVGFFADAGFNAVTPENIFRNAGTSFGLNLSVPIYDGKQRKLQYNKISLAENTRIFYRRYYSSQYKIQFDQLTRQLKLTDNLLTDISCQILEQEKLIEMYKIELGRGLVRFLDFITVINNYVATKNTFLVTDMNRLQIINQLNYLK